MIQKQIIIYYHKKKPVVKGFLQVYQYLNSLNYQYGNHESKYFYIVKTPITFFDDYNLDDKLKKRISLIDLPGSDIVNNKFNHVKKYERSVKFNDEDTKDILIKLEME